MEGGDIMAADHGGSNAERDYNLLETKHPIFLSHSGAQKCFVEQLCLDIEAHDRYPFLDKRRDSLSVGCNFPELIFEAISQCQVAVVVLSEDFFSRSKWPMLELVALMKRKAQDPKLIIMPVFLGMTYAHCHEKGNHDCWSKQWLSWAEKDKRVIMEEWQDALKVFDYTNGIALIGSDEVRCRREIVEAICKDVFPTSRPDDSHVQGRSRLCKVIRQKLESMSSSKAYGVRVLGLYGVGGIGKSTACMTLCNDYFKEFHGRVCHVEFGDGNELQMLQKVLKKLTKAKHELIENLSKDECKDKMKRAIKNQRVLLAIDNVSASHHVTEQAKDMLRSRFEQGSIVVVTARSLGELRHVNIHESECMEMPELHEDEAVALFLYHAAPGLPLKSVEHTLTRLCVERCRFGKGNGVSYHYHPLAVKVLGGQLGSDPGEWLGKLEGIDPFNQYREKKDMHPIFSILRRSFDTLNDEDQLIFMDAAIFAPSTSWQFEINIFEWLGMVHDRRVDVILTMLRGLKIKSLLENLGDGSRAIGMHDLWREFAVLEAKRSELYRRPSIYGMAYVANDPPGEESCLLGGGWEGLQRISVVGGKFVMKGINLSRCSNLRVLELVDVHLESEVLDVSSLKLLKSLRFQMYHSFFHSITNLANIAGLRCLRNLVYLRLGNGQTETSSLYEEIGTLTGLQVLDVQHLRSSSTDKKFPDFSRLNSLQYVRMDLDTEAEKLAGLSSKMTNLTRLNLGGWSTLRSCPGVGDLLALEELGLHWCIDLEELPNLGRLKNLRRLDVSKCSSIKGVPGLGDLVSLQEFQAYRCSELAELPDMRMLHNLEELIMGNCPLIKAIPGLGDLIALKNLRADFGAFEGSHGLRKLTKLETVWVQGWSSEGLLSLSDLVNLKRLVIGDAKGVDELTGLFNLPRLQELEIRDCGFKGVPSLSSLTALTSLEVLNCNKLEGLPQMNRLSKLEKLAIMSCYSMREWKIGSGLRLLGTELLNPEILLQLQTLELTEVAFTELPDLSSFPHLKTLRLRQCPELTKLTSSAPLIALESLNLWHCGNLRTLPDWRQLVSLRDFRLWECGELQLTTHEVAQLEKMCPGLDVGFDRLFDMDHESEDGCDDERAGKRVKLPTSVQVCPDEKHIFCW